jgi:hypothetical protein
MASQSIALESNRSTGPRTPEGKARSSQNSRKHGFSAKSLEVLPAEQADFKIYQNELLTAIKPQPGPQSDLFHQLLHAGWTLRRLARFELEILENGNPFDSPEAQTKLDRIERYRAGHRRAYSRILDQIRKLQTDDMLWSTTHDQVQDQRESYFPLANPAAPSLNKQVEETSGACEQNEAIRQLAEYENEIENQSPRHFDKTNSHRMAEAAFAQFSAAAGRHNR